MIYLKYIGTVMPTIIETADFYQAMSTKKTNAGFIAQKIKRANYFTIAVTRLVNSLKKW